MRIATVSSWATRTGLAATVVTLLSAAPVLATTFTLSNTERGWIDQTGRNDGNSSGNNYLLGNCGAGDCSTGEFRDFFGFAIPLLDGPLVSATFEIQSGFILLTQSPSLIATFTSLGTTSSFSSLGTGTAYGSFTYTIADRNLVEDITLNAAGIADIMADQGATFLLGGRATSPISFGPSQRDQLVFGSTDGSSTTTLVLETAKITAVPEPSSFSVFGGALLGLALVGWRVRRLRFCCGQAVSG